MNFYWFVDNEGSGQADYQYFHTFNYTFLFWLLHVMHM